MKSNKAVIKGAIPFAHELLIKIISPGDIVVDGTAGNGHDTLFLAQTVGENGHVYGFDIQKTAIQRTRERLEKAGYSNQVSLFNDSHHRLNQLLPEQQQVKAAIFNLGYLPSGNKGIVTRAETTCSAVTALQSRLVKGGLIVIVFYPGHPEGKEEASVLLPFFKSLDQKNWQVLKYDMFNQLNDPPFLIAIEKIMR